MIRRCCGFVGWIFGWLCCLDRLVWCGVVVGCLEVGCGVLFIWFVG